MAPAAMRLRAGPPNSATRPLSEADLSQVWEGQTFPAEALVTGAGERLRVIYRGRRSYGAGPDFRDAIIAAPDRLLQGDVELHLRSSDFHRHGHAGDPAYSNVVLHLVIYNDAGGATALPGGGTAPIVALGEWLDRRAETIESWLALRDRWQEPCRSAVERMGAEETARTLDRLGMMRFRAAASACRRRLRAGEDGDAVCWSGVLGALGYGGGRERFRRLAERLPWEELRRRIGTRRGEDRRREALRALLAADAGPGPDEGSSLRPVNRFSRRLEGAATLAARFAGTGILPEIEPLLDLDGRAAARETVRRFTVRGSIGRSRAIEIAANAVLPLLAVIDSGRLERPAERVYSLLALPARYGAVRHLHEALDGAVRLSARRQQGMLYLLKQYCTRGGCGRCPLS